MHHLIYCIENQQVADGLATDLKAVGHPVQMYGFGEAKTAGRLKDLRINPETGSILLLVTDNFLKSESCLDSALATIKNWIGTDRLIPVVADGTGLGEDGQPQAMPTSFERVNNIIHYMNFWQDKYLELRKQKRTDADSAELDLQIALTKAISTDVGETLRYLRGVEHFTLEDFKANNFAQFRKLAGDGTPFPELTILPGPDLAAQAEAAPTDERALVEIIVGSSEELIAENSELDQPFAGIESEMETDGAAPERVLGKEVLEDQTLPDDLLADIPGISLLPADAEDALDAEANNLIDELAAQAPAGPHTDELPETPPASDDDLALPKAAQLNAENEEDELESILDEVLSDEGFEDDDEDDFRFLGEDSDDPEDFDLDSIFDEDDPIVPANGQGDNDGDDDDVYLDMLVEEATATVAMAGGTKLSPEEVMESALDLFADNQVAAGITNLRSTVDENPHNTTLRYYLAYSLARYGKDVEGARDHLETLLKQDPRHPEAWYLIGELAENQEDFEGAKKCYEKAVKISPDYPDIYYRLGLLTAQQFPDEAEQAATYFRRAIKQNKLNADAEYALANVLNEQLGEPEKAIKHFRRTLVIQPSHPFANYDLALLHHRLGDQLLAAGFYEKAVEANPALRTDQNDLAFGFGKQPPLVEIKPDVAAPPAPEVLPAAKTAEQPMPEKQADGPIVLISGATSGIGRATAELFAKNGFRVIITGRREERLEAIKNEFSEKYSADIQTLMFDVRNADEAISAMESLPEAWKEVDILINNAGLSRGLAPIHLGDLDDWDTMIDTNVKGLLYLTRAIAPHMVARRRGHIINVASSAGKEVYPGGNVYSATKAAVDSLTRSMRLDLYQHNIRVSQVAPGHVEETEFARVRFNGDEERASKVYEGFQPLKSSDVAEVIFFMATRPAHVNIQDVYLFGTQQAGSNFIDRSGRG